MKILLFGATGMVGQGVLRECLNAGDVTRVVSVGRTETRVRHEKLREIVRDDLFNYADIERDLTGLDACFFCLGISSAGMTEEAYVRLTYDLTLAAAGTLARINPEMTFIYVSGAGTDSSESGRVMWARVKGRIENALQRLPFKAVYLFRPGVIQPLNGAVSKTTSYRILYALMKPFLSMARRLMPDMVLTTETMGQAMLAAARKGDGQHIVESTGINALAAGKTAA